MKQVVRKGEAVMCEVHVLSSGKILVAVKGFQGEDDFYKMHSIIKEELKPEDEGYSVDSMCVGGYFVKDGIRIRTSSESPYDSLSFFYDPKTFTEEQKKEVLGWIEKVTTVMHFCNNDK